MNITYASILLAGLGSAGLLLGAFGFQYIGDLAPCPMCIWQRWPHAIAVLLAILSLTVLWSFRRPLAVLAVAVMAVSTGLGVFHAGVEQKWWTGPTTCTGADPAGMSSAELLDRLLDTPLVRCDEIVWDLFGITMAGWNAIASVGFGLLWLFAALQRTPTRVAGAG